MNQIDHMDWAQIAGDLDAQGWAVAKALLGAEVCAGLSMLYEEDGRFRGTVTMARHGFGKGEYRYFAYPLPGIVADLRTQLYARLAPIANCWNRTMGIDTAFPDNHADFLARCHAAGQARPTPLILRYGPGDYN